MWRRRSIRNVLVSNRMTEFVEQLLKIDENEASSQPTEKREAVKVSMVDVPSAVSEEKFDKSECLEG